ncbi:MAG: undecaprenyl-diphosphate phosphatase [Clostridiales bacterium]|jgi:undecaprenyl-diphosphatase|nr:undecaprenyl-diphosphate phosphatase [Clostridiales bacterium]
MNIIEAFILGLIQGLTEFLPVSSSGHLVLFSRVTGTPSGLLFDLIVHCATLLAVVIVYYKDVKDLIRHPLSKKMRLLLCATLVTGGGFLLLKGAAEGMMNGWALPYCFAATGVVLILGAKLPPRRKRPQTEMGYVDALIIGGAQGIAALPGLSRSGLTISTAHMLGCKKEENAGFCFLLSIPVILGSTVLEAVTGEVAAVPVENLLVGFFTAFVGGLICLKILSRFLSKGSFAGFSVYLFALSLFLLLNDLVFQLF